MPPTVDAGRMRVFVDAPRGSPFNNAAESLDMSCLILYAIVLEAENKIQGISDLSSPVKSQDHLKMARVKKDRRLREKFRKRKINLFKKANELAWMTESKIYIVVQHDDKYHTYKSTEEPKWPPSGREVVSKRDFILSQG